MRYFARDGVAHIVKMNSDSLVQENFDYLLKDKQFPSTEELKGAIQISAVNGFLAVTAIDTNVLLRFLFKPVDSNNPKWQVDTAEASINKAGKVFISSIVIAETEWVLERL